jgi:PAS domain S-box-containing protein
LNDPIARADTRPATGDVDVYEGVRATAKPAAQPSAEWIERDQLWGIIEQSLNEVYVFSAEDWRFKYANQKARQNLGWTSEALCRMTPVQLQPKHTKASFEELLAPLAQGKQTQLLFCSTHRRSDGSEYPVEVHLQLASYQGARAFLAIAADVTAVSESEASRRRTEERCRVLIERSLEVILLVDRAGRITFASPSVEKTLGWPIVDLIQTDLFALIHPDERDAAKAGLLEPPLREERFLLRARHRGGHYRTLEFDARDLLAEPVVSAIALTARDVTERVRLEGRLRQAQRLECAGRLAAGVAHDLNNIVAALMLFATAIEEDAADGVVSLEEVRELKRTAERGGELATQLLAFARKRSHSPRTVDLEQFVPEAERLIQGLLGGEIELSTRLQPGLWRIEVDPTHLQQVLLNLTTHARDAMPSGGTFSIEAANVVLEETLPALTGDLAPGQYVVIRVKDTGSGIAREVLPNLFEPFFTTKPSGKGRGLGLATVSSTVQQCGGHIDVDSELGVGTTFSIYLARSLQAGEVKATTQSEPTAVGGERVLVVDDNDLVRIMVVRTLKRAGYVVDAASGADEAFELARSGNYDLLLTDVIMPDGNGTELVKRLLAVVPSLRVLYMSGCAEGAGQLEGVAELLPKPFKTADMLMRVRRVLDKPS